MATARVDGLLPRGLSDFHSKKYWNDFFLEREKRSGGSTFEWYGEYRPQLQPLLKKYIKPTAKVLNVGCGNSDLSADMYDDGFQNIVNVDFSEVVIDEMRRKNKNRSKMSFLIMDMRDMKQFEDGSFDVVLDKGAMDAIYSFEDESEGDNNQSKTANKKSREEVEKDVGKMLQEIARVINRGGVYLCVTLAQHYILEFLLKFFAKGWIISVHEIVTDSGFLPFLMTFTKASTPEEDNIQSKIETYFGAKEDKWTLGRLKERIKDLQLGKHTESKLKQWNSNGSSVPLQLWSSDPTKTGPRYSITVVDQPQFKGSGANRERRKFGGSCAVFIVPQGKEHEWLFSSEEGQAQLADMTNFKRLIIASMQRLHHYQSMDEVKAELSAKVMELMVPDDVKRAKEAIPFLTAAEGLGSRTVIGTMKSQLTGHEMMIEDVPDSESANQKKNKDSYLRRMIFMNNPHLIQSEARVKLVNAAAKPAATTNQNEAPKDTTTPPTAASTTESTGAAKKKKKKKKKNNAGATATTPSESKETQQSTDRNYEVDYGYLACEHHHTIISGLSLLHPLAAPLRVLVVGLGGGSLPMFFHKFAPSSVVDVVELDEAVGVAAKQYFGFVEDSERLHLHIEDGLKYIERQATDSKPDSPKQNLVIIDADSKDLTVGMSCPPKAFVEEGFLRHVRSIIDEQKGMLVLNLVCRATNLYKEVIETIKKVFAEVHEVRVSEENVNTIVFALPVAQNRSKKAILDATKQVASMLEKSNPSSWQRNKIDLVEALKGMNLQDANNTTTAAAGKQQDDEDDDWMNDNTNKSKKGGNNKAKKKKKNNKNKKR